jgi:endo-1,4-beta-xylanase
MVNAVNTIAENFPGLDQQVTEYDESVYNAGDSRSNYGSNIPPSVLAEQGWLYADTFDAFKQLAGKISRVTIWGMADDDTWLDSFPVNRTDYPLPFDMGLQAKPAYWGIVDPSKLPGAGLKFTATVKAGTQDTRIVTLTATNGSVGPAYRTQINGFTITQVSGPPCAVTVKAPGAFPIALGDLAANGTASAKFTLGLTANCNPNAQWTITVPWSANTYENGTFTLTTDFNRGK